MRIFLLICNLLVPLIMWVAGFFMVKHPPKKINHGYGYRTKRSMKNEQTWAFAHAYCGKLWMRVAIVMALVSVACYVPLWNRGEDTLSKIESAMMMIQCVVLIFSIYPVESALKKNFDDNGNRKS